MRRAAGSGVLTDEIRSHPPVNSVVRAEARRPRLLHWRWRQGLVIAVAVRTGGGKNKKDKRSSDASGPLCGLPERGSRPPPNAPRIPPLLGNRARRRSIRSNPAKHQAGSVDSSALPSLHLRLCVRSRGRSLGRSCLLRRKLKPARDPHRWGWLVLGRREVTVSEILCTF